MVAARGMLPVRCTLLIFLAALALLGCTAGRAARAAAIAEAARAAEPGAEFVWADAEPEAVPLP